MRIQLIVSLLLCSFLSVNAQRVVDIKYPNGNNKEKGTYVKGEKDGEWLEWSEQGQPKSKIVYKLGEKIYEKQYRSNGRPRIEIDYRAFQDLAIIRNYDNNGILIKQHYAINQNGYIRNSSGNKGQIGYVTTFATKPTERSGISLRNPIDEELDYHINLPSFYWDENGKVSYVTFGGQGIGWYPDGTLQFVRGYFDRSGVEYDLRWNKEGQVLGRNGKPIEPENDTTHFKLKTAKSRLKAKFKDGLPDGTWKNKFPNGKLWYKQEFDKGVPTGDFEAYYFDGSPHVKGSLDKGLFHGPYQEWFPNGNFKMTGTVHYGRKDSTWMFYNKQGMLVKEETWVDGKLHGVRREFYVQNGKPHTEYNYVHGVKDGPAKEWFFEGGLEKDIEYKYNYAVIKNDTYYKNGQLRETGGSGPVSKSYHQNGQLSKMGIGPLMVQWDEKGKVFSMSCILGDKENYYIHWKDEGGYELRRYSNDVTTYISLEELPETLAFFRDTLLSIKESIALDSNGLQHGAYKLYFPNGALWVEGNYEHGHKNGVFKTYSLDGQVITSISLSNDIPNGANNMWGYDGLKIRETYYVDGAKQGQEKIWYTNTDQLKSDVSFKDNIIDGDAYSYYENGDLYYHIHYVNGRKDGIEKYNTKHAVSEKYYVNDTLNGPATILNKATGVTFKGQYANGKQHGEWIGYDSLGNISDVNYYDYGEKVELQDDRQCQCKENYKNFSDWGYKNALGMTMPYNEVDREVSKHFVLDSSFYERIFYHYSNIGAGYFTPSELVFARQESIQLNSLPGVDLVLNPCLQGNQFNAVRVDIRKERDPYGVNVKKIDPDHEPDKYVRTDSFYFDLLNSGSYYSESENRLAGLLDLYGYDEYFDDNGRTIDSLMTDLVAKTTLKKPNDIVDVLTYLGDFVEDNDEEIKRFVREKFFSEGELVKGSSRYYTVEKQLEKFFQLNHTRLSLEELDDYLVGNYSATFYLDRIALEFSKELLSQWDTSLHKPIMYKDELAGARLLIGLDKISYNSKTGIDMEKPEQLCFSTVQIGNTQVTLGLEGMQLYYNSGMYSTGRDVLAYVRDMNELYSTHISEDFMGVLFKRGAGQIYLNDTTSFRLQFENVLISGDKIVGTAVVYNEQMNASAILAALQQRFTQVYLQKSEGRVKVAFVYGSNK